MVVKTSLDDEQNKPIDLEIPTANSDSVYKIFLCKVFEHADSLMSVCKNISMYSVCRGRWWSSG